MIVFATDCFSRVVQGLRKLLLPEFLHLNLRTDGDIPRAGLIPVGEQDSPVCEAEKKWYFNKF